MIRENSRAIWSGKSKRNDKRGDSARTKIVIVCVIWARKINSGSEKIPNLRDLCQLSKAPKSLGEKTSMFPEISQFPSEEVYHSLNSTFFIDCMKIHLILNLL